ncbi:oxidoreductase [Methylobacterium oryzae]|uniref:Oxidoreductase n=2 Tax=Methylobacterium oryzae TaxID=334852 RepID=A0ABU7TTW1_9HYPH
MVQQVNISRVWDETSEIKCFELVPENGAALAVAEPGAHIDVHVGGGLIRQYSLWNGPDDGGRYLIGVKKEAASRGGSVGMHGLSPGRVITIDGPRNHFPLVEGTPKDILMAGGIGITPLLSMARHLAASDKPYELHLFSRNEDHTPFKDVLARLDGATVHAGLEGAERDAVVARILGDGKDGGAHLYTCGPKPFMTLVVDTAANSGWDADRVHLEYFSADVPAASADDAALEVVLARSGKSIIVAPGQTITDAMLAEGVEILTSCEQGVCGTCLTTVLEGEPDHRDVYLSPSERSAGKTMLPCVSRCKGPRLVLDL